MAHSGQETSGTGDRAQKRVRAVMCLVMTRTDVNRRVGGVGCHILVIVTHGRQCKMITSLKRAMEIRVSDGVRL